MCERNSVDFPPRLLVYRGIVDTEKLQQSGAATVRGGRRRRNTMNVSLTVAMTEQMRADVETEAIADNVSAADVIRMALAEMLPRMKERRLKRVGSAPDSGAWDGGVGK